MYRVGGRTPSSSAYRSILQCTSKYSRFGIVGDLTSVMSLPRNLIIDGTTKWSSSSVKNLSNSISETDSRLIKSRRGRTSGSTLAMWLVGHESLIVVV